MDKTKLRKEFANKNKVDAEELAINRHKQLLRKLSEHKYGGHKKEGKEENAR